MNDTETIALLREIRDLIAGQERMLESDRAIRNEMYERYLTRSEEQSERQIRRSNFAGYVYLFFLVMIGAALGAHWGR